MTSADSRDAWEALASQSFIPVGVSVAGSRFTGTMEHFEVDGAGLTRVRSEACEILRTKDLISESAPDACLFSVQLRGTNDVSQGGVQSRVPPGHGVLYFSDVPHQLNFSVPADLVVLQVPITHLGITPRHLRNVAAYALPTQAEKSLKTYTRIVRSFFGERPMLERPEDAIRVSIEMLGHALRAQLQLPSRARSHDAMLAAFRRHINERLDDLRLDVPSLATAEGVSIRTVHGVFAAADTSPAAYIRTVRLDRARRILQVTNQPIADIAASSGFSDATTLTRAFSREFGISPGAYRSLYREQTSSSPLPSR